MFQSLLMQGVVYWKFTVQIKTVYSNYLVGNVVIANLLLKISSVCAVMTLVVRLFYRRMRDR